MLILRRLGEATVGLALGVVALQFDGTQRTVSARGGETPTAPVSPNELDEVPMRTQANDVVDYELRAVLDVPTHTVRGEGTIVWRNNSKTAVSELWVHLYLNAFKNQRTAFLRAPIGGGRGTEPIADWGHIDVRRFAARELDGVDLWPGADKTSNGDADDETDIRVPLPHEVKPGETLTIDTSWDAKMPSIVERTGYWDDFYMVAQWFPKLARLEPSGEWRHFPFYHLTEFYSDFGTYDVSIDVPAGFVVGATGARVSSSSDKGRDIFRYHQRDVHDFAWTAWRSFREKTTDAEGVHLRCLYPPGYDAVAERELDMVAFGLRYYGEHYGRYPYDVLTIVHPPRAAAEAGGMEYPTLITTGGVWYDAPFVRDIEAVTIHEFGHQYFYGLVATDEQTWPLLDEGLNSFAEADAMAARFGPGSVFDFMGLSVGLDAIHRGMSVGAVHNEPVAQPAQAFASGGDYAKLVYGRTATILGTFARVYGHDVLMRALGRYTRRYRFEHPTLEQFVATFREVLGDGPTKNLKTALFDKGWVDYATANGSSTREEAPAGVFDRAGKRETVTPGTLAGSVWQGWALVMRHGTLRFPVDIELWGADGSVQLARWDGEGDFTRVAYRGASELVRVIVDPSAKVTLDENLLNNGMRLEPNKNPWRIVERTTYAAALGLQCLLP
jgi:hypothetical protein